MPAHIAKKLVQKLIANDVNPGDARVLVMGVTFKEDVTDIRNTKVVDLINELKGYSIEVEAYDPWVNNKEFEHEYGFSLIENPLGKYHAVIVAVSHTEFKSLPNTYFINLLDSQSPLFFDLKGIFGSLKKDTQYWRL